MNNTHSLRIALTTTDNLFDAGGVENSIARIARGLASQFGIQIDILMLDHDGHTEFHPRGSNGITQIEHHSEHITVFKLAPWTGSARSEQRWLDIHYALLELAAQRQYALMQAFYASTAGFPTVYAAKILQIPSIVSIRGNDLIADVFHTERFPHLKWALENATRFTAVSQEGLDRARILCGNPAQGRVILNSIRPEDFAGGTQDLQLPRPLIGSLAVFKNKKGIEVLLCAFNMLLQHHPAAHLLLAGYMIPEEQSRFEELITRYHLAGRITLTGRIPRRDALRYLRTMDVFAFSSLHDGCPNAILEAMLAGVPIVATRAGALPQMIEDGKHGLLVRPGSATELYEALARILSMDSNDRWEYGKRAQERVLTEFTPQRELDAYWELYQECLSGPETK